MVTGDTPYPTTDIFLDEVVKNIFPLLSQGQYLFTVVSHNGYLTRDSNSITTNDIVSVASWVIPLITKPFWILS